MSRYLIAGLRVDADDVLPGAQPYSDDGAAPDVVIRRAPVPDTLPNPTVVMRDWMLRGDDILLSVPGIVRLLVQRGSSITFEIAAGVDDARALPFVMGSGVGIVLQQLGRLVLHASAIAVDGAAVLFCGRSGAGKSTLAAALSQRGHTVVADDVAAITIGEDATPCLHRDYRDLKLWRDAADGLELRERAGVELALRAGKYYISSSGSHDDNPLPLAAIYFLRQSQSTDDAPIVKLDVLETAAALRLHAYRPRLVRLMQQEERYFKDAAHLADRVPAFSLGIERGWDRLPTALEALEASWSEQRQHRVALMS